MVEYFALKNKAKIKNENCTCRIVAPGLSPTLDYMGQSLLPQVGRYERRIGRPRQDWTTQVMKIGTLQLGGERHWQIFCGLGIREAR